MKTLKICGMAAAVATACLLHGTAEAGLMTYSWQASADTAQLGDTVTMTLHVNIDPMGSPFFGLAASAFSINVGDAPAGGLITHIGPGLNLHPSFAGLGNPGTVDGLSISGIQAGQFPLAFNPAANQSTQIALYAFTYTITDAAARDMLFSANVTSSMAFTSTMGASTAYTSQTSPFTLTVNAIPAPGALALLATAGIVGVRRRRHQS